jgi:MFS family permease
MEPRNEENKPQIIFGLRRNVFFLGLVSLFNDFSNQMIQSVMPAFLAITLGISPVGIGLIEGGADAVASFLKIFSGWFSDKIGKRKLPALLGYALSVSTRPFFALASRFSEVFGLRIIDRMGKGFRDAPRDALLAESADQKELGKSFGYQRAMDAMGGMLGPLGAFLILPMVGGSYQKLFLVAFGVGLLTIFTFVFVKEIKRKDGAVLPKITKAFFREHRRFSFFILSIFVFGLGTLPITLMLLKPIYLGVNIAAIPLLYFIYNVTFVGAAIPLGKISDKFGKRKTIIIGFAMAILSYVILAQAEAIWSAILAFVVLGFYSAATDGIERATTARLVNPQYLATGEGLLEAAVGISSLLSGLVGGLIWTIYGPAYALYYAAALSFLGALIFVVINFSEFSRDVAYRNQA